MKRPSPFSVRIFALILLSPFLAFAADCEYSTSPDGSTIDARYDVGRAYEASDAVVVGRVGEKRQGGQALEVKKVVKAPNAGALTYPGQPAADRPVYEGIRLPKGRDFVFILRAERGNTYTNVDGQPNVCPNIFPVINGFVKIGHQAVSVDGLERFFESRPEAIAYP